MRFVKISSAIILTLGLFLVSCRQHRLKQDINATIQHTKAHFVPDSRTNRFNVEAGIYSDSLVLTGSTTVAKAKAALLDSLSGLNKPIVDHIKILPAANLENKFGLVNFSVTNIRTRPSDAAAMATQALLGMPLRLLKKRGEWFLIRTPNDYIAWGKANNIEVVNRERYNGWKNASKLIYMNTYGFSYQQPSEKADHVTDLVAGDVLELLGRYGSFYKVQYPDGRTGYVAKDEAKPFKTWNKGLRITDKSLISVAKTMLGVPYLWGGTSTKGVDCSGFTHTIYYMNGKIIPRDASQQVQAGVLVDTTGNWSNLQVGDLLFFGQPATDSTARQVVHVAMWIGNGEYIQALGHVRITSMDPEAPNFGAYNLNRYLQARRYIGHWKGNIINVSGMYREIEQDGSRHS